MNLEARGGFEIDPEITAKLLRMGHRIHEVPVDHVACLWAEWQEDPAFGRGEGPGSVAPPPLLASPPAVAPAAAGWRH